MQPLVYGTLTPDDIRSVVHFKTVQGNPAGVGRVEAGLTLLDFDLNHVATNTAPPTNVLADNDFSNLLLTGSVSQDMTQPVQRALALTMRAPEMFDFDPLHHLIQPRIRYWTNDKRLLLDIPIGIFVPQWDSRALNEDQEVWTLSALDLTSKMQKPFITTYSVVNGFPFRSLAINLLKADELPFDFTGGTGVTPSGGIHSGPGFPESRLQIGQNSDSTIGALAFDWRDSSQLDVLNKQVLGPINFSPLAATSTGQLVSSVLPWWAQSVPQWEWKYITDNTSIFVPGSITQSLEGWDKIGNIINVVSENNQAAPIQVIKENTSLDSAVSLARLKRGKPVTIQDDNIPDIDTANLRASLELQRSHLLTDRIQFTTFVNPFHESGDYYYILVTDKHGLGRVQPGAYPFQGVAWSIDLISLQMTHDVGKVVAIN